MVSDNTTFFLCFAAVFGALLVGLWRLEAHVTRLEQKVGQWGEEEPE